MIRTAWHRIFWPDCISMPDGRLWVQAESGELQWLDRVFRTSFGHHRFNNLPMARVCAC